MKKIRVKNDHYDSTYCSCKNMLYYNRYFLYGHSEAVNYARSGPGPFVHIFRYFDVPIGAGHLIHRVFLFFLLESIKLGPFPMF